MSIFRTLRGLASVALFVIPVASHAEPVTLFTGPFQSGLSGDPLFSMAGNLYQRETYPIAASRLQLIVDSANRPAHGDTWLVSFERKNADGVITRGGTIRISYRGGDASVDPSNDCFLVNGFRVNDFFCSVNARAEFGFRFTYGFRNLFTAQCIQVVDSQLRPLDYQIAGEYLPGGVQPFVSLGTLDFRPSEFPIRPPLVALLSPSIPPRAGTQPPSRTATVVVDVFDDIQRPSGTNCGVRVPNVVITAQNIIVPGTGSHKHFTNPEEVGTGEYSVLFGQLVEPPADAGIKAKTDQFNLVVSYAPGEFGLSELIKVKARDPLRGTELDGPSQNLNIRVPGLIPLDTANVSYALRGSFGNDCDIGHNDGPTDRRSHYVLPEMYGFAGTLAGRFFSHESVRVSYNDASLEFGGFFDDGTSNRADACHVSHRTGRDIDVNVRAAEYPGCVGEVGLNCPATHPLFAADGLSRRKALIVLAEPLGGRPVPEEPLHFRLQQTF